MAVIILLLGLGAALGSEAGCLACHTEGIPADDRHFAIGIPCAGCHRGDPSSADLEVAHAGLVASPGVPGSLRAGCGGCHPERADSVRHGLMFTGRGIVSVTRYVLGEQRSPDGDAGFESLGDSPADSLLRKLCGGCHLGSDQAARHAGSPGMERRGGCLGCHLDRQGDTAHPRLTARVGDAHCFGCHARSGRISLSYAGLAEVDAGSAGEQAGRGYLDDGRLVEHRPEDVHHQAGMACIDCHTAVGLMGDGRRPARHQEEAVDIGCADCHDNRSPRVRLADWRAKHPGLDPRIPFRAEHEQEFLVTARHGTPLWHIELRPEGLLLHRKIEGGVIRVPQYRRSSHSSGAEHARLTCAACHAQWAPQCYGCHISYDPKKRQWDQLAGEETTGRWSERRWGIRNELSPLGVRADGRIALAIPGMISTIEHPAWKGSRFQRLFAFLDPHTSGRSRSCDSCHASSVALGLGDGVLTRGENGWLFQPARPIMADGLPADAWTSLDGAVSGGATRIGSHPLNPGEMRRILDADSSGGDSAAAKRSIPSGHGAPPAVAPVRVPPGPS
jgi:hypothetical protein